MKKLWQIIDGVYFVPRAAESKKPKQIGQIKEKRFCRNTFIESFKELRFIIIVLEDFSFFFYVFHYITKLQIEIQGRQRTSRRKEAETFRKYLAL